MKEPEALRKLQKGSENALVWFIDRYAAYVGTILSHIIGAAVSNADLEELASDVFCAFWYNASAVFPGKERAYLGAIARNKAKEFLRHRKVELPLEDDVIQISGEDPEQSLEAKELSLQIREAVFALSEPDQEIFLRHYYGYQPVAAIAQEMGINLSTVKTRLFRGRKKLKEILLKGGYHIENADL